MNKGDAVGKIWLKPRIKIEYFYNFSISEQKRIIEIIELNSEYFKIKME